MAGQGQEHLSSVRGLDTQNSDLPQTGIKAETLFVWVRHAKTGYYLPIGLGAENTELPPVGAPKRKGLGGRKCGAPYAKPRSQKAEGLST